MDRRLACLAAAGAALAALAAPCRASESPPSAAEPLEQRIPKLIADLRDESFEVRTKAAKALAACGAPAAPALADVFNEKNPDARALAGEALAKIGLPAAAELVKRGNPDHLPAARYVFRCFEKMYLRDTSKFRVVFPDDPPPLQGEPAICLTTGSGHGGNLDILRATAAEGGLDILSARYARPRNTKEGEPRESVEVRRGTLRGAAWDLLRESLARIDAVRLESIPQTRLSMAMSSADFAVFLDLKMGSKQVFDYAFAGYAGDRYELSYAKPRAAASIINYWIDQFPMEKAEPNGAERAWITSRIIQDFARLKGTDHESSAWWVNERLTIVAGHLGTLEVLPALRGLLEKDTSKMQEHKQRPIQYAIDAAARLLKIDLQSKEVKAMDLEGVRLLVLDRVVKAVETLESPVPAENPAPRP